MDKLVHRQVEDDYNPVIRLNPGETGKTLVLLPLKMLITEKQQKKIVKKIFNRDRAAFEAFVALLEPLPSWKEAFPAIEAELARRGLTPYKAEAVLLTSIVYRRYYPYDWEVKVD